MDYLCNQVYFTQQSGKTGNFAKWKFLVSQTDESDDFGNFLTHVTTFQNLCTTLMTHGDNILTALKTSVLNTVSYKHIVNISKKL